MSETVRRAIQADPELTAELWRRGMFGPGEKAELAGMRAAVGTGKALGTVQFATLLAQADAQFAARAVLRKMLRRQELQWLNRLLQLQKRNGKREELVRIVERALEGRR
jgi:predicted LPLAT superfamily acyltransferase